MPNPLITILRRTLFSKNGNLVSLDDPYSVIAHLLRGYHVTGILDAGASRGHITKRLLKRFPAAHAYAFEPNPLHRDALERYAKEDPRVHPQFLALSDAEGAIDLHITESPGSTSIFKPGARLKEMYPKEARVRTVEQVRTVTIDGWVKQNGSPEIQVMKFDIQGGELRALTGGTQTLQASTLLIYIEILFNSLYEGGALFAELDLLLRKSGFVLYNIYKPKCDQRGLLMWGNAIFAHSERLRI